MTENEPQTSTAETNESDLSIGKLDDNEDEKATKTKSGEDEVATNEGNVAKEITEIKLRYLYIPCPVFLKSFDGETNHPNAGNNCHVFHAYACTWARPPTQL